MLGWLFCSAQLWLASCQFPFQVLSKPPGHDPFYHLSCGVLHCEDTVSVRLAVILVQFEDWLEVTVWPILGNLSCCEAFMWYSVKSSLLSSIGTFLMCEHLTLSGPRAVSLLSPESVSVNSSFVIRPSSEPASVRVLSSTLQTALLSSRLLWLLYWTNLWSSVEPLSSLVFSTALLASMRPWVVLFAGHSKLIMISWYNLLFLTR